MKSIHKIVAIAFLFVANLLFSPNAFSQSNLDIAEYLKQATAETIYPSDKQLEMIKALVPKESYKPSPTINDREFWDKVAKSSSGKEYLSKANALLDKKPEIPISDETYRTANLEGNRGAYKPKYYRTMDCLEHFILAECMENKGRFLSQISAYSDAIMAMKSWLHPNHDDKNNGVLEGKRVSIDLGARKFGSVLALANVLLENKIPTEQKKQISTQLQWRITDNYLKSCKLNDENNSWIKGTSNWNAVCTSGALFTTLANSQNQNERLAAIGCAINSMKYYLSGFGSDGYCSEGLGYWGYGFGHYLYIAELLKDYSGGKIDLIKADNPTKLKNIGNFPESFEIQKRRCAPFADGVSKISESGSNFATALSAYYYQATKPTEIRMEEAFEQLFAWQKPALFATEKAKSKESNLPDYSFFDDFGMLISRGKQKTPFSIAIKAGHNAENHNHSDVGTYTIVLNNEVMTGDIGAPSYTAGAFSQTNPARSSWGHPVARIDDKLQSNGRAFAGTITATEFTKNTDKVAMDIQAAYEIPALKSLVRTMKNDKSGTGTITIEDAFSATKPLTFGIAMMTSNKYEIVNANTVIITSKHQKIKAEIIGNGAAVIIKDELVPVKGLREGGPAYRIGVDFDKPISEGSIIVKYTPVL